MTRDRLEALKAAQDEDEKIEAEILEIEMEMVVPDGFMPEFFAEVEDLRAKLTETSTEIEQVKVIHSDILSAPATDEKLQQKLDDAMASIKRCSNQVRFRLKEMERGIEKAEDYSESQAEIRMRKAQHASLSKQFVDMLTDYNQMQTDFRDKCKGRMQRQMEIAGNTVTEEDLEQMLEDGDTAVLTKEIVMTEEEMKQAKQLLSDLKTRHGDIEKLETSIKELHDMFVDMAVIVDSQGEMIDRIEVHVNDAVEWVDRANADMKKAREFQAAARKKKLMMIIAGTILGLLVCMYLKTKLGM